jgi:D-serine deaminase-like pyridoxal phosphate-dependent protein
MLARTPALLVDVTVMRRNIDEMAQRSAAAGMSLWPHAKTHKCAPIGRLQLAAGASGLTVATLDEAFYFAGNGVADLLVAYPLVGGWREAAVEELAARVRLRMVVESHEVFSAVRRVAARVRKQIEVFWEVDSGAGRLGTPPGAATVSAIAACGQDSWTPLAGLLTFPGHAYRAPDDDRLRAIAGDEITALTTTADLLAQAQHPVSELSIGSTPTLRFLAPQTDRYGWQARPGVYVFNDATQVALGAARIEQCALSVAATVLAKPQPDRIILDAGSKALGADRSSERVPGFGLVAGHPELTVAGLYEQHAIVHSDTPIDLKVGERVRVIPNHACAAVNLHPRLYLMGDDDEGDAEGDTWQIGARGPG